MSKKSTPTPDPPPTFPPGQRRLWGLLLLGLMAMVTVVIIKSRSLFPTPTSAPQTNPSPAVSPSTNPESFKPLEGRWVRPDGGYILEVKQAAADGRLEAAYYNPNPIHVSRAQASRMGSFLKVEVELRDVGYPGCLYTLLLEPGKPDFLRGTYYQAALQQTYDIQFERLKE